MSASAVRIKHHPSLRGCSISHYVNMERVFKRKADVTRTFYSL